MITAEVTYSSIIRQLCPSLHTMMYELGECIKSRVLVLAHVLLSPPCHSYMERVSKPNSSVWQCVKCMTLVYVECANTPVDTARTAAFCHVT